MYLFVVSLHVVLCIFMVLIILLQPAKGEVGLAFGGGGSSSVFGPRGPASILQRGTTIVAVLFMVTSITLALYSNKKMLANAAIGDEFDTILQDRQQGTTVPEGAPEVGVPPAPVEPVPVEPEVAPEPAVDPVPAPQEPAPTVP